MRGLNAGAEDSLTRPVDRAELRVRVRNLLRLKAYGDYHVMKKFQRLGFIDYTDGLKVNNSPNRPTTRVATRTTRGLVATRRRS